MDNLTKDQRAKNMRNIRSKSTIPERIIFRELRRKKIYFACHVDSIFGKPDIVFRRKKILVFVDSDFWHGHPKRGAIPKSNKKYWVNKIKRNVKRDNQVNKTLRKDGWKIIRIWEYDIRKNINKCINRIMSTLDKKNII